MSRRPEFEEITLLAEFNKYYWYRQELAQICKQIGIDHSSTKQELLSNIQAYFSGNLVKKKKVAKIIPSNTENITLNTPLLECGFAFNAKFRECFSKLTGIAPFKFTADMGAAWRKVKREQDRDFTIQDMLEIYYGRSEYARYDHSTSQWNQFVKDFNADANSSVYSHKLRVAAILWQEVRNSTQEKTYSTTLLDIYADKIKTFKR